MNMNKKKIREKEEHKSNVHSMCMPVLVTRREVSDLKEDRIVMMWEYPFYPSCLLLLPVRSEGVDEILAETTPYQQ